jgi:hypothetical protein
MSQPRAIRDYVRMSVPNLVDVAARPVEDRSALGAQAIPGSSELRRIRLTGR